MTAFAVSVYSETFSAIAVLLSQGMEAFWKAQDKISQVLEEQFYPAFLLSDLFHSYTKNRTCGEMASQSCHFL